MYHVQLTTNDGHERALHLDPFLQAENEHLELSDRLAEAGLTPSQVQAVEALVEAEIERESFHHAGDVLRRIFAHLSGCNSACAALAHALGLTDGQSISDLALVLGVSKQNVGNMAARVAPVLGPLAVSKAGRRNITRPTAPGEWLTLAEASRLTGRVGQAMQDAAKDGKLSRIIVRNQAFFEEADLLRWLHELTIETSSWTKRQPRHLPKPKRLTTCASFSESAPQPAP